MDPTGHIDIRQYSGLGEAREDMPKKRSVALLEPGCCGSVLAAPLDEQEALELARGFAALADPVRLRLLSLLASADSGEVCACDLVQPVGRSQPTVSHHLKILTEAGLVTGDRRGRWIWYSIVPGRLADLRAALADG
jgi:ArsR family transcriptional regulator, arsenate/arsenite/antimonite-responsive transcriptional repressor